MTDNANILKKATTVFLLLMFLTPLYGAASRLDSLLNILDNALLNEKEYVQEKESHIAQLKHKLRNSSNSLEDSYFLTKSLADEYEVYQCDSALHYTLEAVRLARQTGNADWINSSLIQRAETEAKAGMFHTSQAILAGIDPDRLSYRLKNDYYMTSIDCSVYVIEYRDGYDVDSAISQKTVSLKRLSELNRQEDTYEYAIAAGFSHIENGQYDLAEKVLANHLGLVDGNSREMASIASLLSDVYRLSGDRESQLECLALSAIADVRSCVRENISLRVLAMHLFELGDIERSNAYIKKSLSDANFYNSRLRNIQVARVLPIIDNAYRLEMERHHAKLGWLLIAVSVLTCILMTVTAIVLVQIRKLSRAKEALEAANARLSQMNVDLNDINARLDLTNRNLAEANRIKELFIGTFLDICTEYIDKLKAFKRKVSKKIKTGQTADLIVMTSNVDNSPQDMKELYVSFDRAFLNIYPNFIQEFNGLLREEERYEIPDSKSLNQELRIFALIKLGITDIPKIQSFLNYSTRTIYNYRSKVKAKALDPHGDFDEKVKSLCLF